jgi:hypothetical protein
MRVGSREMAAGADVMHRAAVVCPFSATAMQRRRGVYRAGTLEAPDSERLVQILKLVLPRPAGI